MSEGFLKLMVDIFPDISKETQSQLHKLIRKKEFIGNWLFSIKNYDELCQGDILEPIPVVFVGRSGDILKRDLPVLLLNNSCDMQIDDGEPLSNHISFVPLFPLKEYLYFFKHIQNHESDIKENVITHKFYVSFISGMDVDYVADLSMLSSVETQYFYKGLENGDIKKTASLSNNGYYYFLAKLTLHFMRPESENIKRENLN